MTVINAKIFTMNSSDEIIENGFVRVKNGKITEVGDMSAFDSAADTSDNPLPDNARDKKTAFVHSATENEEEIIDAKGASLYPGFIDAHSHLGMWEDSIDFEGADGNEESDPCTPQMRAIDGVNPYDRAFDDALAAGITSVMTGPGSANPVSGQIIATKTTGECIDDMVIKAPAAIKFALGENPKKTYSQKDRTPCTRMATAAIIREQLFTAKRYLQDKQKAESEDGEYPDFDMKCEALIPLIKGEIPAHFHAHRLDDIFTAIRIAKEFSLKLVIVHATAGYLAADRIKGECEGVICGPIICDRCKPELSDLNVGAAGIYEKSGVLLGICTDHPEVPQKYLPLSAALCVKSGLSEYSALKAITSNAALLCGIFDTVGSIEPGKDADMCIFDGSPLALANSPKAVFVNGKAVIKNA